MNKGFKWLGVLVPLLLLISSLASAAQGAAEQKESFLVGLRPGASAKALAAAGVEVGSEWAAVNAAQIFATPSQAKALERNPNVAYVEPDLIRRAMGHGTLPYQDGTYTWGLQAVHAPEAWGAGARGASRSVCVLDTGIDLNHPEFYRNGVSIIKGYQNFTSRDKNNVNDVYGHGTHVAGTVAGQLNASGSYIGVAPDIDLYIAKVLGDDGSGRSSWIMNGVKWCAETAKANILSLSLGGGMYSRTEDRTYNKYYSAGALIVAAAGNSGDTSISYPAGYKDVVSVAAVDSSLNKASFSQSNSDVELAGPGVGTLSAVPRGSGATSSASEDGTVYPSNVLEFSGTGNVTGPLVECGLADSTSSCQNKPASGAWIALISRGSISFADKVNNVKQQGASAAIITNNDTANPDDVGNFTLGTAGSWMPSVSVSYNSGVAIRNGGLGTGNVTVESSDYAYYQGTSMATPHVSAVAAVAWSANPTISNATVRSILASTAKDLGATGRDNSFGYGLVQADAAVSAAKQ